MSLTLELTPELKERLREAAARKGVAPESYAISALEERVRSERPPGLTARESRLLADISAGLPTATWQRYRELCAVRRDDRISDEEYGELLRLTEEVEVWNARRVELLSELARLRKVPLRELVAQMGLAPPPYA
jgi:hypothetical protein